MKPVLFVFLTSLFVLFALAILPAASDEVEEIDVEKRLLSIKADKAGMPPEQFDTSGDGEIDYMLISDPKGKKLYEILDYNRDGIMDDFLIYKEGTIVRREIDSNGDGLFDIWVSIKDGSMVEKLQQDSNFDGVIDKVTNYGEDE